MPEGPRIALIHALEQSVAPARAAFAALWPEARPFDLLDSSLSADLAQTGSLDPAMIARFQTLAAYAAGTSGIGGRTAGILFTCSAFGPAIDAVKARLSLPVFNPNEAAFEQALRLGPRIALVVSFAPSLPALSAEFHAMALALDLPLRLTPVLAEGALEALQSGDGPGHDRAVQAACAGLPPQDAVVLGQFSLARAAAGFRLACPVLTTPGSAVEALRRRINSPEPGRPFADPTPL